MPDPNGSFFEIRNAISRGSVFAFFMLCIGGCSTPDVVEQSKDKPEKTTKPSIDFTALLEQPVPTTRPRFTEVAKSVGVDFQYFNDARQARYFFPEILGGGFACLDFDLDGWPDLYCGNGRALPLPLEDFDQTDRLYRNTGGQFVDVSQLAFIFENGFGHGCAFGDLNADGFDDIAVACFGSIAILINQGDGTFLPLPAEQFPYDPTWSVCPLIFDANRDGIADLLVVNYVQWNYDIQPCTYENIRGYCGPGEFDAIRDYLFINQGNGHFVEQGESHGLTALGKGLAVAAVDWDHDLKPEIYIANDLVANFYYRLDSETENTYTEAASPAGVAVCVNGYHEASMSVTVADFARNGWPDIFVTNYYKQKNTLYANQGQARFRDVSFSARTQKTGELFLGFGAVPLDYDKDGWMDIFVGNGHVLGPEHIPNQLTNQILRNNSGAFDDVSSLAGDFFSVKTLSRGVATFDFDQDLDTDIVVNHLDRPISILRNDSESENHSVAFQLCSPHHEPLEGSRIEMTIAGSVQTLPYLVGGSYFTDSQKEWIVGVGTSSKVDKVVVYWSNGKVDTWENLDANVRWQFQPGRKRRI